jgi:hypothetical protein
LKMEHERHHMTVCTERFHQVCREAPTVLAPVLFHGRRRRRRRLKT